MPLFYDRNNIGVEAIEDGVRYIQEKPYGLDNANEIYIYLPGTKTADLDEAVINWIWMEIYDYETQTYAEEINNYILYNKAGGEAFIGYGSY